MRGEGAPSCLPSCTFADLGAIAATLSRPLQPHACRIQARRMVVIGSVVPPRGGDSARRSWILGAAGAPSVARDPMGLVKVLDRERKAAEVELRLGLPLADPWPCRVLVRLRDQPEELVREALRRTRTPTPTEGELVRALRRARAGAKDDAV